MAFKPCFKIYDVLFSVYRISINLGQMTDHHLIFHVVVVSVVDWLKFETRSSFLRNFGMAYKRGATLFQSEHHQTAQSGSVVLQRNWVNCFFKSLNFYFHVREQRKFICFRFTHSFIYMAKREISIPSVISALSPFNVLIKLPARSTESSSLCQ